MGNELMAIVDRGWNRIKRNLYSIHGKHVRVGLFRDLVGAHLVMIGVYQHYGTRRNGKVHIPAVPFLSKSFRKSHRNHTSKRGVIARGYVSMLMGRISKDQLMHQIGAYQAGEVQAWIARIKTPHNADSTIARKGFDNRLVHHGHLRLGINYKIEK